MERFVQGPLFTFIKRGKFVLLGFWFVALVAAVVSASTQLNVSSSPPTFGDQNSMFVRFITVDSNFFKASDAQSEVHVLWGLDTEEPVIEYDDDNRAVPRFDGGYAGPAVTSDGQQKVLSLCQAPDAQEELMCNSDCLVMGTRNCPRDEAIWQEHKISIPEDSRCLNGRYCIMELVQEFAAREGEAFPVSDIAATVQSEAWRNYTELRNSLLEEKGVGWEVDSWEKKTGIRINKDGQVGYMWVTFNGSFPEVPTMSQAQQIYEDWDKFVTDGASGTGALQTASMYLFMRLQTELLRAAVQGICTSLAVSLVALLIVTYNFWIALIGFLTITVTLVVFIGVIPLLGWELGVYECMFLIMTVGLSVDYTVHLLHAYNESPGESREQRVQDCLSSMGITVLSGSFTTLLAAIPLFLCYLRFFQQYGTFIFFVILFSIFCAVLLLPPMLLVIGPVGEFGDIKCLYMLSRKLRGLCNRSAPAAKGGASIEREADL